MKKKYILFGIYLTFGILFSAIADDAKKLEEYKDLLKENDITPTEEGIIKHLIDVSPTKDTLKNIDQLIEQLAADSFLERNSAQKKLEAMGSETESKIEAATKSKDPEIRLRARQIVQNRQNNDSSANLFLCFETLKLLKAKNAVPAILKSSPLCSNSYLKDIAEETLVALIQPKDMDTIEKALQDKNLSIRVLAITGYGNLVGLENSSKLYPYLKAENPEMRLAAAKSIANAGDRKAISAFIELMSDKSVDIRSYSANYLRQFTKKYFKFSGFDEKNDRIDALAAWKTWLAEKGETAELHFPLKGSASTSYLNGHTLIALGNGNGGVVELDRNKKEVWRYEFLNCWSAEKLPNGNYLLGGHGGPKLIEVTPKKKIVWEYETPAMGAIQLPNGNILAATHGSNSVIEIRKKDKKIVWRYDTNANCFKAFRLPNGNTLVAGYKFIREITPKKKVVWEYNDGNYFYGVQPLPNGNIMVSDNNKSVYELNRKKEKVWEHNISSTTGVYKLPNGNVLITTNSEVIEVTQKNEVVWRYKGNNYGFAKR